MMRMVEVYFSPKLLLLLIVAGFMPCLYWCANWQMCVILTSAATAGNTIFSEAYMGEGSNAMDNYDSNDIKFMPPYSGNPNYVKLSFPHSTWGADNGDYTCDIRSDTPMQKTWDTKMEKVGSTNNYYVLSWNIPSQMPIYYSPKLIFGPDTIDMRTISSYAYSYTGTSKTCSIRLDYNHPPLYNGGVTQLSVVQNQSQIFSWANQISDPELNPVTVTVAVSDSFSLETNDILKQTVITPLPAFKGSGELQLTLSDGINTPIYNIPITVLPSTPMAVQNIVLSHDSTGVLCTWDAVSADLSNSPLGEVHYRISGYNNPECSGIPVLSYETTQVSTHLPSDSNKLFIRITTINE